MNTMKSYLERSDAVRAARDLGYSLVVAAVLGGLICIAALVRLGGHGASFGLYQLWIVVCGALGAPIALMLARDEFGRAGLGGLARAVAGTLWVSLFAAVIAGTLALPLYGTMFAPLSLAVTFTDLPVLGLVWLAAMIGVDVRLRGLAPRALSTFSWRRGAAYARLTRLD